MTTVHTETAFEEAIENHLIAHGYERGNPADFDRKRCLDPTVLIPFLQQTQAKTWRTIADYHGENATRVILDELTQALTHLGMLHVLRHGFSCFGKLLKVAYFAPANRMNPKTLADYSANRLTVTRQLRFSEQDEKSLDLLLSLNGLPIITAELKNHLTNQNVHNALRQYRDEGTPLPVQGTGPGPFRR